MVLVKPCLRWLLEKKAFQNLSPKSSLFLPTHEYFLYSNYSCNHFNTEKWNYREGWKPTPSSPPQFCCIGHTRFTMTFSTQQRKSGRILTTAHIPWERYTMLLLLLPSCSSLYIPRLFYSNRPVIVHTGVTFFLKRHHCFFHRIFKQRIVLQNVVMNGIGRFFWKNNDCYFKKGASPL